MNRTRNLRRLLCTLCTVLLLAGMPLTVPASQEDSSQTLTEENAQSSPDDGAGQTDSGETAADGEPTDNGESQEAERPEPDAYFEPVQTNQVEGWPQGPAVWAESAVVMDIDSGTILYSKNMDAVKYPASITKIMTTLLAIENSSLNERVTFSENAIYGIERDSSHIGIRVGEILSMEECLYGMMLESANEVCLAVAEHISGSVDAFVDLMNERAAQLGCTNTHFTNPNGLPDENHYTTAHDMALIAQAAYRLPLFRQICQTQTYVIPKTNMCGEQRWLNNHHKMLPDGIYAYEGCTGGKTGFTQAALNTLVTFAERDGRRLVCVSLRTNGAQIYADTASMLDYGFQNFQNVTLFSPATCPAAHFLYPSLYFGRACTPDELLSACTVTIPLNTDVSQLTATASQSENQLMKSYQFSGYTVATEQLSTDAIHTLLTCTPGEAGVSLGTYSPSLLSQISKTPAVRDTASLIRSVPLPVYLLSGLLLILIIMELVLAARRKRRKKSRKKKNRRRTSGKKK
ncbi:MAG TPA: D-alanyl-D-alanine carboxypeptidase [Candidatus Pullilachnospira intestinigallinarum]|nr:D-alanyl-D-alanine carboxypeptidase [Candidatus Pullilachnospira intestinigallinarum]